MDDLNNECEYGYDVMVGCCTVAVWFAFATAIGVSVYWKFNG